MSQIIRKGKNIKNVKQYPVLSHLPSGLFPQVPVLAGDIAPPQGGHYDTESISERELYP